MKMLFWVSLFWVFYAYAGYMLLLAAIVIFKKKDAAKKDAEPFVTMIIAAFNEEKAIEKKIRNCFELEYPKEKIEFLIVSDASTDRTDEIVESFRDKGIKHYRMNERKGKTAAQNYAVRSARGDILIFSDATTIYKQDAVRKLVRNFSDKNVGIAAGEEVFRKKEGSSVYDEVSFSWKYERLLRRLESGFNTLIGVSGCIFAIRRELYKELDEGLIEDFALPLLVAEKGYRVHLEKDAVAYEESVLDGRDEFNRKARIVSGGVNVVFNLRRLLNPVKYPKLAFQIVSHKIFRWTTPVSLVTLLASNIALAGKGLVYNIFLGVQITGYLLAETGYFMRYSKVSIRAFKVPFYFLMVNAAAVVGIFRFFKGERKTIWETVR